jgi:hypothetical protein
MDPNKTEKIRKKKNFENGKIYRLINVLNNQTIYIGSTCSSLQKRLWHHKNDCKRNPDRKIYQKINEIDFENIRIILIEEHSCEN